MVTKFENEGPKAVFGETRGKCKSDADEMQDEISRRRTSRLRGSRVLGVWWSLPMLKEWFPNFGKVKKRDKFLWMGQNGVLLPLSKGNPEGTTIIYAEEIDDACRKTDLWKDTMRFVESKDLLHALHRQIPISDVRCQHGWTHDITIHVAR